MRLGSGISTGSIGTTAALVVRDTGRLAGDATPDDAGQMTRLVSQARAPERGYPGCRAGRRPLDDSIGWRPPSPAAAVQVRPAPTTPYKINKLHAGAGSQIAHAGGTIMRCAKPWGSLDEKACVTR